MLWTKTQELIGFLKNTSMDQRPKLLLHHFDGGQGGVGAEKGGLRRLCLDLAVRSGFQVRLFIAFGKDAGPFQTIAAPDRHPDEGEF